MRKALIIILVLIMTMLAAAQTETQTTIQLPHLEKPSTVKVDDHQLYIVDGHTISIYSLPEVKLIKRFGRKGQGPQEFQIHRVLPLYIQLMDDSMAIYSMNRISYFNKKGEFIKERPMTTKGQKNIFHLRSGFLGRKTINVGKKAFSTFHLFDKDLNLIKEVFRRVNSEMIKGKFNGLKGRGYDCLVHSNRIFICDSNDVLHAFDAKGNPLFQIENNYQILKVTDAHEKAVHTQLKTDPRTKNVYHHMLKDKLYFPDTFPAIRNFEVDQNHVYVIPYKEVDGKSNIHIYDMTGKPVKKTLCPIANHNLLDEYPFTIGNNTLYQIVENEETDEWELRIIKL